MNKKALMLTITLIAVAMLATPMVGTAQACRHRRRGFEKVPVSAISVRTGGTGPTKTWTIGDKFVISCGMTAQYSVTLILHTLPEETLVGTSDSVYCSILNLETDVAKIFYYEHVWTFPEGTFEGPIIMEVRNLSGGPPLWDFTILYCVLRGTGAFEGQTIRLSYDGPAVGAVWTGFLFKR